AVRATEALGPRCGGVRRSGVRRSRAGMIQQALDLAELVGHDLEADVELRVVPRDAVVRSVGELEDRLANGVHLALEVRQGLCASRVDQRRLEGGVRRLRWT